MNCGNTKNLAMTTPAQLIRAGSQVIRNAASAGSDFTVMTSYTLTVGTSTKGAISATGGKQAGNNNIIWTTMLSRFTFETTISSALIRNAWIRSLWYSNRKWTSRPISLSPTAMAFRRMREEMQGL